MECGLWCMFGIGECVVAVKLNFEVESVLLPFSDSDREVSSANRLTI